MNTFDIANTRLINQHIAEKKFKTAQEVVGWMGAMQGQDFHMSKWAVGTRLPNSTEQAIVAALDKGEIIRTHLLRPTWHIVAAKDIYWMLELTAPQIKALQKSRDKELELTESIYTKSNNIIEKALIVGNHLTREELMFEFEKAKIETGNYRGAHLMMRAELDGLVGSGVAKGNKQTYALLEERVPKTQKLTREEALGKLANIYFTSHSPATLQDFIWWSGLSVTEAKRALEMVKPAFIAEIIDSQTYWWLPSLIIPQNNDLSVHLLPAFDEFLISYKDRRASLPLENQSKAFTLNGIFRPIIVIDGQVKGLWKRTIKQDKVLIELDFFRPSDKDIHNLLKQTAEKFGNFLGKKAELIFKVE